MEIKNIPEEITEQEMMEWVAILVERKENQKLAPPVEAVETSKTLIDKFRTDNGLAKKYETAPRENSSL